MKDLNVLDLSIFVGYFVVLLIIGFWSGSKKKEHTASEFFLTSNTLPWYVIGFSIIAAGVSSEHFMGAVGYSYNFGMAVSNWEWLNGPSIIILVLIFIPFYLRTKVVTMPQFLGMRFDHRLRTIFALLTILIYVFINLAGVIYSGGLALKAILGFDSIMTGILIIAVVGGVFTIYGGMEAVAWTNVFQSVLLLGGGILVSIIGFIKVPGGFTEIIGTGETSHLILPADHPEIPWPALIVLALSTNMWFYCTNQCINQSALGAKNESHAKLGILFAAFLAIIIPLADVFPGLIAKALNLNIADAEGKTDEAYIIVVNQLIPIGLRGIVFAGLCGAIISTIEALTNACSTIFSFDLYKRVLNKDANDKKMIRAGRIMGAIVLITGVIWAPMVGKFGHIFQYFQQCWAFVASPMIVVFVLGIFWKKFSNTAALITICLSFPMFLMPYALNILNIETNAYIIAGYAVIFVIIFAVVTSLLTQKSVNAEAKKFTWNKTMLKDRDDVEGVKKPIYKKTWFWIVLLVVIYVCIYIKFW